MESHDAEEVVELIRADSSDLPGGHFVDVDELTTDWSRPGFELATDAIGVVDDVGALVAFAELSRPQRAGATVAAAHRGRGIGSVLLSWIERRAVEVGAEIVGQTIPVQHDDAVGLLTSRGYAVLWTTWVLELPADAEPAPVVLPAGWSIRAYQPGSEDRAAYRVVEDAFGQWPDRPPVTYEEWAAFTVGGRTHAPWQLQLLVTDDGAVAGVAALALSADGDGWVEQLAVSEEFRYRGFGRALLTAGFAAVRAHGAGRFRLSTDSRTGALGLYRHIGMHVVTESVHLTLPLSSGVLSA